MTLTPNVVVAAVSQAFAENTTEFNHLSLEMVTDKSAGPKNHKQYLAIAVNAETPEQIPEALKADLEKAYNLQMKSRDQGQKQYYGRKAEVLSQILESFDRARAVENTSNLPHQVAARVNEANPEAKLNKVKPQNMVQLNMN